MKVVLRRINKTPLDFQVKSDEMTFKGYLQYHSGKLILLKADLEGKLPQMCDICAEEFQVSVKEEVEIFISDGTYEDNSNLEIDVVESYDGEVDMEELLHSEIELIKSDYYSCEECQNSN